MNIVRLVQQAKHKYHKRLLFNKSDCNKNNHFYYFIRFIKIDNYRFYSNYFLHNNQLQHELSSDYIYNLIPFCV